MSAGFSISQSPAFTEHAVTTDLSALRQAYVNEKVAPEILRFETELVARVEEAVKRQDAVIAELDQTPGQELPKLLCYYELNRAKYLLRCYYRSRLKKIEQYAMHILDNADVLEGLSNKEQDYAKEVFMLYGRHLKETILKHLPPVLSSAVQQQTGGEALKDMISSPPLDKHVFCRVLEDRGVIETQEEGAEGVDLNQGDLVIVRYQVIRNLLQEGAVELL